MAQKTRALRGVRGNGSIPIQRADGRWEIKLPLGVEGGARRRKSVYGRTRKEVQEKANRARSDLRNGQPLPNERLTVKTFFEQNYLPEAQRLEASTYRSYEQMARLHVIPALGHLPLAKLSVQQVQAFLNEKSDAGYATRTVEIIRAVLRQALGLAETWGLAQRNVAKLAKVPRSKVRKSQERRHINVVEAGRLLAAARGERLEALYTIALQLGLRQGEALALRWGNIDLEARTLVIDEAVQRVKNEGLRFKETKTRQMRKLPLPLHCINALREHRRRQDVERHLAGENWHELDLVFSTKFGTPLDGTNVSKYFKRVLQKAGLPDMRYYDLRHSAASLLAVQGVPARVAMEVLGHSDIRITLNTYTHVLEEAKWGAAEAMDKLFAHSQQ